MPSLKILYLEDSPTDTELVLRSLKKEGYDNDCVVTADPAEIERLMKEHIFDVILSDYNLHKFTAMEVLKKRNELTPATPFIVVTGTLPDEVAVELLKQGATDYILKDRVSRLCPAIDRALKDKEEKKKLAAAYVEIRENEARYRELFESSSDLIFLIALDGRISLSNPAFCRLLACPDGKPVSSKAETLVPEEKRRAFRETLAAAAAGIRPGRLETIFLASDGRRFEVDGTFYPRVQDGKVIYTQAIFRDLTEQRSLEAQFRQSQKMEAIGRLAGGIAHDFNNILGAIEGYATLVTNTLRSDDPIRPDLEEIRKAVARAAELTKQLLTFSRKQALQKRPCDLNAAVNNIQKMITRLIGENINLELELDPDLPCLMADPQQLDQMLINLAVNARDAMPQGGKITISTRLLALNAGEVRSPNPAEAGRNFIMISVKDTGTGISRETQEHVFEPFFTTKEKGKGTGLGLPIVYGVAKQHNGWIQLDSEPGKGAEFSVYFPAKPCDLAGKDKPPSERAPGNVSPAARILILEDDEALRGLADKALKDSGHTTETSGSLTETLALFRERGSSFDIIFADVVLADGKITDIMDELSRINPKIGFILTSGYLADKGSWDFLNGKKSRFIPKPYSVETLLKAIHELLKPDLRKI